jgi:hypothetical protein
MLLAREWARITLRFIAMLSVPHIVNQHTTHNDNAHKEKHKHGEPNQDALNAH